MRWLALSCFALAGFSPPQGPMVGNAKPVTLQSGQWESTTALTEVDVPGVPEKQLAAMRQTVSQSQCLSPEQAAHPLNSLTHQSNCSLARRVFAGGTIDFAGTCLQPGQGKSSIVMTGTYTADSFAARFRVEGRFIQPGVEGPPTVRVSAALRGRRTGRCTGPPVFGKPNGVETG